MSHVTNVILTFYCRDDNGDDFDPPGKAAVKAWCLDLELSGGMGWPKSIDVVSGGSKHIECGAYVWGVNYFKQAEFLEVVRKAPWYNPEYVQVFLQDQHQFVFTMMTLDKDRQWYIHDPELVGEKEGRL